ncbi:MAG: hypothetical protein NFW16_07670 [Candidatus Accumulibacter sp.]|uniref:hypothetical protein n=1 Tax=Accumulibacter sp. TaxID=2053492 RepID=UPI0025894EF0|nr:hypothetical protein [Accumulibacter sp.]MCM8621609.1 hypothetical protein [Accumulibacter sp.]
MKPWHNKNDCEHLRTYHAYYPVPTAALLWCGVPHDDVQEELNRINPHPHIRGVFTHPFIPCFEVRCRIIHDAIESRTLAASRENGKVTDEHIAPERRHVSREHLKAWIAKEHPADKPAFLFDEVERKTHSSINADTFRALQADRDAARAKLERVKADAQNLRAEVENKGFQIAAMEKQIDALNAKLKATGAPDDRSETTYLNIIAALLDCIAGNLPNVEKHPSFASEAKLIEAIDGHFRGYGGLSQSTLSRKFPAAKRSMAAQ